MPLIIIGLLLLIGILIYALLNYIKGESDNRPVRERYPNAFKKESESDDSDKTNTLYFPVDNVEKEKDKRNIK